MIYLRILVLKKGGPIFGRGPVFGITTFTNYYLKVTDRRTVYLNTELVIRRR